MAEIRGAEHWDQWPTPLGLMGKAGVFHKSIAGAHGCAQAALHRAQSLSFPMPTEVENWFLFQIVSIRLV